MNVEILSAELCCCRLTGSDVSRAKKDHKSGLSQLSGISKPMPLFAPVTSAVFFDALCIFSPRPLNPIRLDLFTSWYIMNRERRYCQALSLPIGIKWKLRSL